MEFDIHKNSQALVRVAQRNYNDHDYIDIRTFYATLQGEFMPSKQGCTLPPEKLPELIKALQKISK